MSLEDMLARHPDGLFLVVDGVQDPGNGGALVRTAVAAGVAGIVTTSGTVDLYGPRALRGAGGADCPRVPWRPTCPATCSLRPWPRRAWGFPCWT